MLISLYFVDSAPALNKQIEKSDFTACLIPTFVDIFCPIQYITNTILQFQFHVLSNITYKILEDPVGIPHILLQFVLYYHDIFDNAVSIVG